MAAIIPPKWGEVKLSNILTAAHLCGLFLAQGVFPPLSYTTFALAALHVGELQQLAIRNCVASDVTTITVLVSWHLSRHSLNTKKRLTKLLLNPPPLYYRASSREWRHGILLAISRNRHSLAMRAAIGTARASGRDVTSANAQPHIWLLLLYS